MAENIVCEHFDLTDALRDTVLDHFAEIQKRMHGDGSVSAYLVKDTENSFVVELKVHAFRRDIVGKETSEDIYQALISAKKHVLRQMADIKEKKIHNRRH